MNPRAVIVRTAGTNCDREAHFALAEAGFEVDKIHVDKLVSEPLSMRRYHLFLIPGGFTYGDDVAAGKILANELRLRLLPELSRFIDDGKLVLGICNGFQVLAKAGLLPNFPEDGGAQTVTLTFNDGNKFEDRWIRLTAVSDRSVFVRKGDVMEVPIAHGEGKFVGRDEPLVDRIEREGLAVLRYAAAGGGPARGFPENPNGSVRDIAGICDPTGRVLGLMPHPERASLPCQHPRWTREGERREGDGFRVFRNAAEYVRSHLA